MAQKKPDLKSHYRLLRRKWIKRHQQARDKLHRKHKEALDFLIEKFPAKDTLASGAIGLLMMSQLVPTATVLTGIAQKDQNAKVIAQVDRTSDLNNELSHLVPDNVRPLTGDEEAKISEILSRYFNIGVKPDIDGLRLNRTYGVIGAEQHLARYPGDTLASQVDPNSDTGKLFYASGMAPGRGAWGYFANTGTDLDELAIAREKWYIAVQTFAAPNYNRRLSEYRDFFKFRKMLVINAESGQAVVADIGDSGPAVWTGKHLGGSPEVMYSLGLAKGARKGPVLYFFIDDVDNKIPLGPIKPMGLPNSDK